MNIRRYPLNLLFNELFVRLKSGADYGTKFRFSPSPLSLSLAYEFYLVIAYIDIVYIMTLI